LSLLKTKEGEISKRLGGFDLRALRSNGVEPMAINSFLSKIGTSDPIELRNNLEELARDFNINKFSKSPITYDINELERLNNKFVHNMTYEQVKDRVTITKDFWDAVKHNISTVAEVKLWNDICNAEIESYTDEVTIAAAECLPEGVVDVNTWDKWIESVKQKTNKTGKLLFMPIRKALTGMESGPELKFLIPLLGREKILKRLKSA
jgi:glutamyl-tRNA synthetase